MPKRSNEFQQIIYMIQKQLAGQAFVSESKMLRDKITDADVEVDVVIEAAVAGVNIAIGVECTAQKRPATVEWVSEMIGKHQGLPLDKTILVSKSGFTEGAIKKANGLGVETITLERAEQLDWQGVFRGGLQDLMLGHFQFSFLGGTIDYDPSETGGQALSLRPDLPVFQEGAEKPFTLASFAMAILGKPGLGFDVMKKWIELPPGERKTDFKFDVTVTPNEKTTIEHQPGQFAAIRKLHINAKASVNTTPVRLEPVRYLGKKMAYGSVDNIFPESTASDEKVLITLIAKEDQIDTASLLIPQFQGKKRSVLPLKLAPAVETDARTASKKRKDT
jgi:hypothetical protein